MPNPIPAFDHNQVLPPHKGNPAIPNDVSPYECTTAELCERFATSPERIAILKKFMEFRGHIHAQGLHNGFQWIDGSFLEDIEARESRAPRDIDVITVYFGYDMSFQHHLFSVLPEFFDFNQAKARFDVDHYPFDATNTPILTVELTRYWIQLFSHNRDNVWKGMLKISLNTPAEDAAAIAILNP